MKKVIMMALFSVFALTNLEASHTNVEVCKTYIHEAQTFQETMKHTRVDEATLAFYKDNVVSYCGNVASKMPYKEDFFALELMKKDTTTVSNCKLAIKMAKNYVEGEHTSAFIVHAHKLNVADNCGTLVAKKAPSFCLFDVIDDAKKDLKERCITSIEKANTAKNADMLKNYKNEVVVNCGKLQAHI